MQKWHIPLVVITVIAIIYLVYVYSLVPSSTVPHP